MCLSCKAIGVAGPRLSHLKTRQWLWRLFFFCQNVFSLAFKLEHASWEKIGKMLKNQERRERPAKLWAQQVAGRHTAVPCCPPCRMPHVPSLLSLLARRFHSRFCAVRGSWHCGPALPRPPPCSPLSWPRWSPLSWWGARVEVGFLG